MTASHPTSVVQVERRLRPSATLFFREHVERDVPVVLAGLMDDWAARKLWSPEYFRKVAGHLTVPVKRFVASEPPSVARESLADYVQQMLEWDHAAGPDPPYLHDFPIFLHIPEFTADVQPFPSALLPSWYRSAWWLFAQFFCGPAGTATPLHFDCLETHNLFFNVTGRKRFLLVRPEHLSSCYPRGWRWFDVNAESPDLERHPAFAGVPLLETTLEGGEVLFIPSRVAHQVRSLEPSISFNLDWHTARSAVRGSFAFLRGMPPRNVYYNVLCALGVGLGAPRRVIYPLYRSYLSYVS